MPAAAAAVAAEFDETADVAILGSGIAGSTLALILARNGARVLLLDHAAHPRFALGESTLRSTSYWMKILAARYGVPELDTVANSHRLAAKIAPTSGIKRGFGFLYHREGYAAPLRSWLGNIPTTFSENEPLEGHWFRQDIDAYLYHAALAAGASGRGRTDVRRVEIRDDGVFLGSADGARFHARYVVDASGYQSVLAKEFALREQPAHFRTESRSLFTHMVGVRPFDDFSTEPCPSIRWHRCTTHHFFDGGWIWVIPFNNHPGATNPLCSVGLNLDLRRFPKDNRPPAEEWREILEKFPSFAPQFAEAKPVRDWVSTGRLQYASRTAVGERFCLVSHACAAVDALYSRGLSNTMQSVNLIAHLLLDALQDDDFSAARFAPLDAQQRNLLDLHDDLVFGSYVALRDPDLVDRWLAIFSLIEQLTVAHVEKPFRSYLASKDRAALAFDDRDPGACICSYAPARQTLHECAETMAALRDGRIKTSEAIAALDAALRAAQSIGFDYHLIRLLLGRANFTPLTARYYRCEELIIRAISALDRHFFRGNTLADALSTPPLARKLAQLLARTEVHHSGFPAGTPDDAKDAGENHGLHLLAQVNLAPRELRPDALPEAAATEFASLISNLNGLEVRIYRAPAMAVDRGRDEALCSDALDDGQDWKLHTAVATDSETVKLFVAREKNGTVTGLLLILRDGAELALVKARGRLSPASR